MPYQNDMIVVNSGLFVKDFDCIANLHGNGIGLGIVEADGTGGTTLTGIVKDHGGAAVCNKEIGKRAPLLPVTGVTRADQNGVFRVICFPVCTFQRYRRILICGGESDAFSGYGGHA